MCACKQDGVHICVCVHAHRKGCMCDCAYTQEGVHVCVCMHAGRRARVCALKPERAVHMHAHMPGSVHTHVQPHQGTPHTCTRTAEAASTPRTHRGQAGTHTCACTPGKPRTRARKPRTHTHTHVPGGVVHARVCTPTPGKPGCVPRRAVHARARAHAARRARGGRGSGGAGAEPAGGQQARQGHAAFDGERC